MTTRRQFLKGTSAAIAGSGIALPFGLTGAFASGAPASLSIAVPSDVPSWDPIARIEPGPISIYRAVFSQPLDYAADNTLGGGVVQNWEWLDDSGMNLKLTLRDDVLFHNGDRMTSADIRFTFLERVQADPGLALGWIWFTIGDIETPDETTAIFRFKMPMVTAPAFLGYLGAYILPKTYFETVGAEGFLEKPVGSGPYMLAEYERDSRIVLKAFPDYFRGKPAIETVTFSVVKDPTTRAALIQSNQSDLSTALSVRDVARLGALDGITGQVDPTVDLYMLHMVNTGPWQDKNLRLAAHHAIDKAAISRAFFQGKVEPLSTPQGPGTPAYRPDFDFAFDTAKAQALMAELGYGPENPVKVTFHCTRGVYPSDYDIARAITQMWAKVGIEADLRVLTVAEYHNRSNKELEGPMLWLWSNATADPQLNSGYFLDPNSAFSVWKSADVGEKIAPLLGETDVAKRIEGFGAFNVWAVEQGYTVPLFQGAVALAYSSGLAFTPYLNGWLSPAEYRWNG
ncbi:ABC transporter substrate-binding protein [Thalassovita mangrovi]|uniref:Twin-arginine translocation signal domain-containing protein n=1 Tax=Thalassovita mangrovi TaxID=2692236 RepID=A0A6L8LJX4_9RHOB|nr:ABC transporter substrate-binding protein [Thalassovita mangrovi]MYM56348.1 twin-arginine translocation signal domain-containing protein [Thalassovita mangrovi]